MRLTRTRFPVSRVAAAFLAGLVLTGCDQALYPSTEQGPDAPPPPPVSQTPERSEASKALSSYYQGVQRDLLSQGLLRTDKGGRSAPFGARELTDNFVRIALFDEYSLSGDRLIASPRESRLRRWEGPVNFSVEFGETVPIAQRRRDLADIRAYVRRLSAITGLPMSVGSGNANFHVLILNEDERLQYGPRLRVLVPGIRTPSVRTIVDMPRSTFCLVNAFASPSQTASFSAAIAVIRAEHPDRLRLSCIHEELAQGLGLANDSPSARPSIFNDDEEFSLLTTHDEMLLKMLYDDALRVGMNAEEAEPIAAEIAARLMSGV